MTSILPRDIDYVLLMNPRRDETLTRWFIGSWDEITSKKVESLTLYGKYLIISHNCLLNSFKVL